jgi:hypothetical protein
MLIRVLALGGTLLTCAVASAQVTLVGDLNGRTWYTTDNSMTVFDARNVAAAMGGTLASIRGIDENDWLRANGVTFNAWIGFSDEVTEGTFLWDDGAPVTFTHWSGGEPNNAGNEDHVTMNWGSNGTWNDWGGGNTTRAIITVAVPEPASMVALGLGTLALVRRRKKS